MKQYKYDGKEYTVQDKQYKYKGDTYPALYIKSNDGEEYVVDTLTEAEILDDCDFECVMENEYLDTSQEFLELVKKGV